MTSTNEDPQTPQTTEELLPQVAIVRNEAIKEVGEASQWLSEVVLRARHEDMPVTRIAELAGLSRQGVYDILKKGER